MSDRPQDNRRTLRHRIEGSHQSFYFWYPRTLQRRNRGIERQSDTLGRMAMALLCIQDAWFGANTHGPTQRTGPDTSLSKTP